MVKQNISVWLLYDGLMYRYMHRTDLSDQELSYMKDHVYIATGFYGLISPFSLIAPHRLDFQGEFKVMGKSLKQFYVLMMLVCKTKMSLFLWHLRNLNKFFLLKLKREW